MPCMRVMAPTRLCTPRRCRAPATCSLTVWCDRRSNCAILGFGRPRSTRASTWARRGTEREIHDGQRRRSAAGYALQAFARIGHGMDFGQAELFQELGHAHGRQRVVVDHQGIAPRLETGGIGQEGMAVHGPREGMSKGLERQGAPGYTLRTS